MRANKRGPAFRRWREVQAVLLRYGFESLIEKDRIRTARQWLEKELHLRPADIEGRSAPERARLMLEELGVSYVKLGQIMASRSDLLPAEWVSELSRLQDDVAPFPYEQVRQIIVDELGAPPEELFARFEEQPLAAASIGQVHRALLPARRPVVVKIQRPGIEPQIRADLEMLRRVARLAEARTAWGRESDAVSIAEEFARSLLDELDYINEGRNAERLRHNLAALPQVHVPAIYWELTTSRVLTMERVSGIRIDDLEALDQAGIDRATLADRFIRSMFQQSLVDGFFHADPHPGNVLVNPETGDLTYIDLGMMGTLMEEQRELLGDMLVAAVQRDSREVVRIALEIGTSTGEVQEPALRRDVDRLLNRYLTTGLADIALTSTLGDVMDAISKAGIRLPSDLTLASKAMVQAEAIARKLDPELKVVEIAEAAIEQAAAHRFEARTVMTQLSRDARDAVRLARSLPRVMDRLLHQIESGAVQVHLDAPGWKDQVRHLSTIANRLTAGLVVIGMAVGSAIAMGVSPQESWSFIPVLGALGFSLSTALGGVLVWSVLRDMWRTGRQRDGG
ncbi:MAG: AarF/ABC1/UbiB kinase family protein [Anaerolineae bacterium]|nr:AarF/ABC1/UbiB kinase family protein [Anaerolineae bacterium]